MKMECISFNEETNVIELEVDEEAKQFLIDFAFNELLRKALGTEISNLSGDCSSPES
jgi:hypothetical protein